MATNGHDHDHDQDDPVEHAKAVKLGYEHRDVDTTSIGRYGIVLTISVFVFAAMAYGSFVLIDRLFHGQTPGARQDAPERKKLPPPPLLQSNVTADGDMIDLRAQEAQRLGGYGWVDKSQGKVHVPIDVAMKRLAEQGLSAKSAPVELNPPVADAPATEAAPQ